MGVKEGTWFEMTCDKCGKQSVVAGAKSREDAAAQARQSGWDWQGNGKVRCDECCDAADDKVGVGLAASMLKCRPSQVPREIRARLGRIEELCGHVGGIVKSRQLVASIIAEIEASQAGCKCKK